MKLALTKTDNNEVFCNAHVLLNPHYTQLRLSYRIICCLTKGQMPKEIHDVSIRYISFFEICLFISHIGAFVHIVIDLFLSCLGVAF